jgi:hypothetical protein
MIELLFSKTHCAMISESGNMTDITADMKEELYLYNLFSDIAKDVPIVNGSKEPEQIYFHIVEKAWECGELFRDRNMLHKYDYELTPNVKYKLLRAFTIFFEQVCQNKMGNKVKVGVL